MEDLSILRLKILELRYLLEGFLLDVERLVDMPFLAEAHKVLMAERYVDLTEINLAEELRKIEIRLIQKALAQAQGKQVEAARMLGMSPTTLNTKIKKYKIN